MQIETYEATETGVNGPECEPEALALIEKLELEGQKSLVRGDGEKSCRIPYEQMNVEQRVVYSTLFPEVSKVEKYAKGPIPVRVLQVVAHGRELFTTLEVWAPQTTMPDPVLVGKIGNDAYLLARWGDALEPFAKLRERAVVMLREKLVAKAKAHIADANAIIAAPDAEAAKLLQGGWSIWMAM